jgi:hypothetical protein
MMLTPAGACRAMRWAVPEALSRTTNMSVCMASRVFTVSSTDSPLLVDMRSAFMLMTSADSRLAAISKVVRVRVEGSKNRFTTVLPCSSGTFLIRRSPTPMKDSARSRISTSVALPTPSVVRKCRSRPWASNCTSFSGAAMANQSSFLLMRKYSCSGPVNLICSKGSRAISRPQTSA